MSRLSQLQGKPEMYKIGNLELEIKPLRLDDMHLFEVDTQNPKQQMEQAMLLIKKVLKESVPDATDEEIKNISMEYMTDIMNAIMKSNKLEASNSFMQMKENVLKTRSPQR